VKLAVMPGEPGASLLANGKIAALDFVVVGGVEPAFVVDVKTAINYSLLSFVRSPQSLFSTHISLKKRPL